MVYQLNSLLSDVIKENPSVLSLLNRLGIFLGVGHANIQQCAVAHSLDPDFLLTVINTSINPDYFPEEELKSFPLSGISDFLLRTNRYYTDVQIPNVGRHFKHLVERSFSADTNLNRLFDYYLKLSRQLLDELNSDSSLLKLICDDINSVSDDSRNALVAFATDSSHPSLDSLGDLISLFIIHLKGTYDTNLCHAVINAIIALYDDMLQNYRIRDRIFSPLLLNCLEK